MLTFVGIPGRKAEMRSGAYEGLEKEKERKKLKSSKSLVHWWVNIW